MVSVNENTVRDVVEKVLAELRSHGVSGPVHHGARGTGSEGVHGSVDDAVSAAAEAFGRFRNLSIDRRKSAIERIREICVREKERFGRMEMEETKIGRLDHKIEKLVTAGERTPGAEFLRTDVAAGAMGMSLTEYAPFGVIGAITPVTHSLPTLASNAISMLAAGNTVVFNAHPSGSNVAREGVRAFNRAMREVVGIDDLITIIDPPTIESAQDLFAHRGVRLLVVTGGPAVARAALDSPKRAIVAGPGNPPVVVDETACLDGAARGIIAGGSYDNNLLCIGEKEVFAVESIFESLLQAMVRRGAYRLTPDQMQRLEGVVFRRDGSGGTTLDKDYIGKDPKEIAAAIGVSVPPGVELLFGETSEKSPFVDHEQMMPVVPFVRARNVDHAIELAKHYEHGFRHTAVIHSRNIDTITKMGIALDTTIFVANGPSSAGIGVEGEGHLSFSIATPTGEGVTSPLTFTRQRRASVVGSMRVI